MALRYFANAPATTLAASCSAAATSISVNSVTGLPIQYPYTLIIDRGTASEEVVSVTAASGTTLTVTRGADSTTAFTHSIGAEVVHGISAQDPREANAHVNATTGVHGAAGAVVGTTDTQTLTNKTLGATNTVNGFTASRFMEADGTGKLVSGTKAIPAGVVVGTTDTQTLTGKTLTSPAINGGVIDTTSTIGGGTTLGAWTAYTPTLTNITLGNGTVTARYVQIGKLVIGSVNFTAGTTTTYAAGNLSISLPVNAQGIATAGTGSVNNGTGASRRLINVQSSAASAAVAFTYEGNTVTNTVPFTFGTSSQILFQFMYEAA